MKQLNFLREIEKYNYDFINKNLGYTKDFCFYLDLKTKMKFIQEMDENYIDFAEIVKNHSITKTKYDKAKEYNFARVARGFTSVFNIMSYNIKVVDNKVSINNIKEGDIVECRFDNNLDEKLICRFAFIVEEINDNSCTIKFIENTEIFNNLIDESCFKFEKIFHNKMLNRREKIMKLYKEIFKDDLNEDYVNNLQNTIKEFDLDELDNVVVDLTYLKNKTLKNI